MKLNKIEEIYYKLIHSKESVRGIEDIVYSDKNIVEIMSDEDYLELISLDYRSKYILHEFSMVTEKYIDFKKLENTRVIEILKSAQKLDDDLGAWLIELYELYCQGYYFLQDLAFGFGLPCSSSTKFGRYKEWNDLTQSEKNDVTSAFIPKVIVFLEEAIEWLDEGKIVLSGEKGSGNNWIYIDKRSVEERKSKIIEVRII